MHKLSGGKRTEADKDFYRNAENIQRSQSLPDGCKLKQGTSEAMGWRVTWRRSLILCTFIFVILIAYVVAMAIIS